ncbi:ATPase [Paracoccus sp. Z330]|uniref:ATPase n=1 Tax=Paracoccus onchidii TaxID=3017813 RepID=A0ABT4Z9E3_9RHOB|nr:ATP12 family protein [Paracoccus onchidii]MDB6175975.1 ATPase [Paracoccus onchidii]
MNEWKARKFWDEIAVRECEGGHEILLDDRVLRTPGKKGLVLPTRGLADAIASEWQAQADVIDPGSMPLTRAANSAIEKVTPQFADVADMLAEYGGTDLICYRADHPDDLVAQQSLAWEPLIEWAADDLGARLNPTQGVIPIAQDPASLRALRQAVHAVDVFGLTALHDLVTLPGSLVIGLAVTRGHLDADEAHRVSRIDEAYQNSQWGQDEEAATAAENRLAGIRAAARFWDLSRTG